MIEQAIPISVEAMDSRTWRRFRGWCVEEGISSGRGLQFVLERFLDQLRAGQISESELERIRQ